MEKIHVIDRSINESVFEEARRAGASDFQAKIIAARSSNFSPKEILEPELTGFSDSKYLIGIDKAASRIIRAITRGELIAITCDFSLDGISAAAIYYKALTEMYGHSYSRVRIYPTNRIKDGLGFTEKTLNRVLEIKPTASLVITAGHSGESEEAIRKYNSYCRTEGIVGDVILTDTKDTDSHGKPQGCYAYIHPKRSLDQSYKHEISASILATILMVRVRKRMLDKKITSHVKDVSLAELIPLCVLSTISAGENLSGELPRAVIRKGIGQIVSSSRSIPFWEALRSTLISENKDPFSTETMRAEVTPCFEDASKAGKDGMIAIKFLLAENTNEALRYLNILRDVSKEDRAQERSLLDIATASGKEQIKLGASFIFNYQPKGRIGINGEVSNELLRRFGKPCLVASPTHVKKRKLALKKIDELKVNVFSNLKENIQISLNDDEELRVIKTVESFVPVFEIWSTFTGQATKKKTVSLSDATKLTRKKIFDGMTREIHKLDSAEGTVCFDITQHTKPKLYIESIETIEGTLMSPPSINMGEILNDLNHKHGGMIESWSAYGDSINVVLKFANIELFKQTVSEAVSKQAESQQIDLVPYMLSDGPLPHDRYIDVRLLDEVRELEPYGGSFATPMFNVAAHIISVKKIVGEGARYRLKIAGVDFDVLAVAEQKLSASKKLEQGKDVNLLVELNDNHSNNRRTLELVIHNII
ncbi:hypothetical protein [Vibrio alginolyticus]|uniref:hypothetical protein n=1 Tax=Vibrio alginolyticus TaxID=663 RepID=UPI0006CAA6C2|nr:hypothetical protein [Vibrio alginolyticus]KPM98546.1 hypothetical protein AOG25_08900 [Vibrio alginolyticus]CAH7151707.1 RecJ_OB domain-containing protein [Vibrio chagasii]